MNAGPCELVNWRVFTRILSWNHKLDPSIQSNPYRHSTLFLRHKSSLGKSEEANDKHTLDKFKVVALPSLGLLYWSTTATEGLAVKLALNYLYELITSRKSQGVPGEDPEEGTLSCVCASGRSQGWHAPKEEKAFF